MSKRNITYIHLFIWLFAIFANLPYSGISKGMHLPQLIGFVFAFLYLMLVFYLFYLFVVPVFLNNGSFTRFFIVSFLLVLIMPFFGYTALLFFRALFEGFEHFYRGYTVKAHMSGFFPVVTAAVFGSFFRIMINWYDEMNRKTESEKQKLAVELELLRSKLNPHFLFNTLNNIDSLIHTSPEEASNSLVRLSEIMRYLTYETNTGTVRLEKEIDYIRNFIELFRIRLKNPEDIRFEIRGDLQVDISPALFIPLLENAFKYASFGKGHTGVSVTLSNDEGIITFAISNGYDTNRTATPARHSGFGLENLKKRLELAYPGRYLLNIDKSEHLFKVEMRIDTHEN